MRLPEALIPSDSIRKQTIPAILNIGQSHIDMSTPDLHYELHEDKDFGRLQSVACVMEVCLYACLTIALI